MNKSDIKGFDSILAAACAGSVSRVFVQPLDVVKIRFQLQVEPINKTTTGKYHGIAQAVNLIYKEEGLQAYFKGHLSSQIQAVSFSILQFTTYDMSNKYIVSKYFSEEYQKSVFFKTASPFVMGMFSGSVATIVTQPFDVFRTRFAAQGEPKIYRSLTHAVLKITSQEGLKGLFRGLLPSLLLIAPQTGFQFFFYHMTLNFFGYLSEKLSKNKTNPKSNFNSIQIILAGGLAGSAAKLCIYPFDVIKKRMQVQGFEEARSKFGNLHISKGFLRCIRVIYQNEGILGFTKGLKMSALKSFISIGLRFSVYEHVKNMMLNFREKVR